MSAHGEIRGLCVPQTVACNGLCRVGSLACLDWGRAECVSQSGQDSVYVTAEWTACPLAAGTVHFEPPVGRLREALVSSPFATNL